MASLPRIVSPEEAASLADFTVFQPRLPAGEWTVEALIDEASFGFYVEIRGKRSDGASFALAEVAEGGTERMASAMSEPPGVVGVTDLSALERQLRAADGTEATWGGITVRLAELQDGRLDAYFVRDGVEFCFSVSSLHADEREAMFASLAPVKTG